MLVLSRKKSESLVIGNGITISIVEIRGDKVRLAITCPREMPVHRQEVHDALYGVPPPLPPRPPQEAGFLQAILESPDDEGIRLIFADWLEERGDPRGEFIRTQCELARLPQGEGRRQGLRERERALWTAHGAAWKSYLPAVLRSSVFERGFVEAAHLTVPEFLDNASAIFAATPLRRLRVWSPWDLPGGPLTTLAVSPHLAHLASLELSDQNLGNDEAALLARSPHTASLKVLVLRGNRIGDIGAATLAGSPFLAGLSTLDLAGNRIGADGARALASSRSLAGLLRLDVSDNPLGEEGVRTLQHRYGGRVWVGS